MTQTINAPVNVSAYYFAGPEMKTFPREIEYSGQAIMFMNGLRYLVQRGAEAIRLFDMSGADGLTYRLRQNGDNWVLLKTSHPELSLELADNHRDKTVLLATEAYLDIPRKPKTVLAGESGQIGASWGVMSLSTKGAL